MKKNYILLLLMVISFTSYTQTYTVASVDSVTTIYLYIVNSQTQQNVTGIYYHYEKLETPAVVDTIDHIFTAYKTFDLFVNQTTHVGLASIKYKNGSDLVLYHYNNGNSESTSCTAYFQKEENGYYWFNYTRYVTINSNGDKECERFTVKLPVDHNNPDVAGLTENVQNSVNIYPNPAVENVKVLNVAPNSVVTLVNSTGKILKTKKSTEKTIVLNVNAYPAGVYFIKILNAKGLITKKIVVE